MMRTDPGDAGDFRAISGQSYRHHAEARRAIYFLLARTARRLAAGLFAAFSR
jgi:hypothetical protein